MDAALFAKMISDKLITDLKKMGYKYPQADMKEFTGLLKQEFYRTIPLRDFCGHPLVYLDNITQVRLSAAKIFLSPQSGTQLYGIQAMENEILATFNIEQIDTSRESVRKILSGYAPSNENENRILGMKKGLEFIADPSHQITKETIFQLYQMTIGDFLPEDDRLLPGQYYRHDAVYIVGTQVEHMGLPWQKLDEYMNDLIRFIQQDSDWNDLLKAALIHFYLAYLHPYFDGNGRMARLMHLWYLVQQGYSSALFVPLSQYIEKSRGKYYQAYTLAEQNAHISGVLDVTPFFVYFIDQVYHKLNPVQPSVESSHILHQALAQHSVTEKEYALWQFILSAYGSEEFSTKQLEKDFGNAAYATIRSFVLKFEKLGLLSSTRYSNRIKYRINLQ